MLKKTVQFKDFNDEVCLETYYFNISKTELGENLDIKDDVERLSNEIAAATEQAAARGEDVEASLTTSQIGEVLALIKRLIRMGYGVRSEDGKRFRKSDEIWDDFASSNGYDAVVFELFSNPEGASQFISGILPADLLNDATVGSSAPTSEPVSEPSSVIPEGVRRPMDRLEAKPKTAQETPGESRRKQLEAELAALNKE